MIIDASALLAVLFDEADSRRFAQEIEAADSCRMSAANWLEAAIRIDMTGQSIASDALEDFMAESGIEIAPVSVRQVHLARRAYMSYGKGTGHPAGLNFGDCFAYALAKETGEPLLFKGDDFIKTDIDPA